MVSKRNLKDWPEVELVCMMAAAVPSGMGDPGGELREALDKLVLQGKERSKRIMLLYSPDDRVLRYAFRPGQMVARLRKQKGTVKTTRAIGLFGEPIDLTVRRHKVMGAGHSDYWPSYESKRWSLIGRRVDSRKINSDSICGYFEEE